MKHRFVMLALVAGSIGLTACANSTPSNLVPAMTQSQSSNSFDLKSVDKCLLTLGLSYTKTTTRSTQAVGYHTQFVGEVDHYLVKLIHNGTLLNTFKVDVNPDGSGKAQATFFNLPAGCYTVYVTAVDKFGIILNKSGQEDLVKENLNVRAHALGELPEPIAYTVCLRDDHINLPKSLIETSLSAISQLYVHCGEPLQTSLIPKRSPELIPLVIDGPNPSLVRDTTPSFDDETSFAMTVAALENLRVPTAPYVAFTTDVNGENAQFHGASNGWITLRDTFDSQFDPTLDPTAPRRVIRVIIPSIGNINLYFNNANVLKAASAPYVSGTPTQYMRIDPELVSTNELFYSARYPNGIAAKRYLIVDVNGNNWNIWTIGDGDACEIIGLAIPFETNGVVKIGYLQLLPDAPQVP